MDKQSFIKKCAERAGLSQKDMREVLTVVGDCIVECMKDEDGITPFSGMKFVSVLKEARIARNPRTGEDVEVPAKYMPKIRFGAHVKTALNA